MAQWHGISRRKPSGGRKVQARGKRATEISTEKQFALVGEPKRKVYRKTGGNTMVRVMAANQVSINDSKTGKTTLGTIHSVVENASDPNYVRRETSSSRGPSSTPTKGVFASPLDPERTASSTAFCLSETKRRLQESTLRAACEARPWTTTPTDCVFGRGIST